MSNIKIKQAPNTVYKQVAWFCGLVGFCSSHWLWSRGKMNRFEKLPQLIHASLWLVFLFYFYFCTCHFVKRKEESDRQAENIFKPLLYPTMMSYQAKPKCLAHFSLSHKTKLSKYRLLDKQNLFPNHFSIPR